MFILVILDSQAQDDKTTQSKPSLPAPYSQYEKVTKTQTKTKAKPQTYSTEIISKGSKGSTKER